LLDNLQRTSARPRIGLLFLAIVVGHVILISSQVQSRTGVPVLEAMIFGAFARVQHGTAGVIRGARNGWGSYVDLRGVRSDNETLRARVAELEVRFQEQRGLAERSERLRALLELKPSFTAPTL
jgi:cell shape-determining protein MreC